MMYRVRLRAAQKTYGQGDPPKTFRHRQDGTLYEFENGILVQSSARCDPDNEVANLDADPPLVRTSFIEQHPDIFEPHETE